VLTPDLSLGRSVSLLSPEVFGAVALRWPDSVAISSDVRTPENVGWPTHLADFSGGSVRLTRSFGTNGGRLLPRGMLQLRRTLAPSAEGFWAAERSQYRISHW